MANASGLSIRTGDWLVILAFSLARSPIDAEDSIRRDGLHVHPDQGVATAASSRPGRSQPRYNILTHCWLEVRIFSCTQFFPRHKRGTYYLFLKYVYFFTATNLQTIEFLSLHVVYAWLILHGWVFSLHPALFGNLESLQKHRIIFCTGSFNN